MRVERICEVLGIRFEDPVYLASPYSHDDPETMQRRAKAASHAAGVLITGGMTVYSPIAHTVAICEALNKDHRKDHRFEFWRDYDLKMLSLFKTLLVLDLDGWNTSVGVREEIIEASRLKMTIRTLPVVWLEHDGLRYNAQAKLEKYSANSRD